MFGLVYRFTSIPDNLDVSTLAHISEGYSAGGICKAVSQTITKRRVQRLDKRSLLEEEFIGALSRCPITYVDDDVKFRDFTAEITGLRDARDKIRKALAAAQDDGDGKAKKGQKKGKKK